MQSFGFEDRLVRVIDRDDSVWFVANDVCGALEIANPRNVIARLDADEKGVHTMDTLGGEQEMTVISESGVYALIFTSRKAAAKRFRKWVTQEVLPAIRRNGRYETANDDAGDIGMEMPDELDMLSKKLAIVREVRIAFGLRKARQAWRDLRLLPSLTDNLDEEGPTFAPIGVIAQMNRSIAEWLDARTESAPGHREWARRLYDDYLDWAKREAVDRDEMVSFGAFGRALSHCGVRSGRSNRVYRLGLKLVD